MEITPSHDAQVGVARVRRALPRRGRRTIGAWCFADHMGPVAVTPERSIDVGPHPHMGLQTVTWLIEGRLLHRDSLGSEQELVAGALNLMTAGHGVSHAEESTQRYDGMLHGIQLWIAQPESTRNGAPAFAHHTELPRIELDGGIATVLIGEHGGERSPASVATPLIGLEVDLRATSTIALDPSFEHGLVVIEGAVRVDDLRLTPGHLGHLPTGLDELRLEVGEPTRVMLIGGEPFPDPIRMWWNFVGRTHAEFVEAHRSWTTDDGRFGRVESRLDRVLTDSPL